jgi:hypothetical protein
MRPRDWERIPISDVLSVWEVYDVTYVPMGLVVQMQKRTREEFAALRPMGWPCE